MDWRRLLVSLGGGATTFLLVGGAIASQVPDIPGGVLGVAGGLFAGLVAAVGIRVGLGRTSAAVASVDLGYAVFGYAFLGVATLDYAHLVAIARALGSA